MDAHDKVTGVIAFWQNLFSRRPAQDEQSIFLRKRILYDRKTHVSVFCFLRMSRVRVIPHKHPPTSIDIVLLHTRL